MEHILVVGADTVVGANLAGHLADRTQIIGFNATHPTSIDGCEITLMQAEDPSAARQALATYRPGRVVICDVAGDSPWNRGAAIANPRAIASAHVWAQTARDFGIPVTLISSDTIFTGPWMFHTENSSSLCASPEAKALRTLEARILGECPGALVVRTHVYGWSPFSDASGWIEAMLEAMECGASPAFDCLAHATPILATDFVDILHRAWSDGLTGTFHIAGAERTNCHRFACTLATVFGLDLPRSTVRAAPDSARLGFAMGEMSLHTRAVCRALAISTPLLLDGLERLNEQQSGGFDRRLHGSGRMTAPRVA
jgi:dTDP-4-dehydrorhamnose reductase